MEEWGCRREKPASCEYSEEEGGKGAEFRFLNGGGSRSSALGRRVTPALWARSEVSAAGNGRRADPQVHAEPAETGAGGRAPAQRRVGGCGGRQQPAAAAGECGASSLPPRAPRAAGGPTPGLPEHAGCPCPCRPRSLPQHSLLRRLCGCPWRSARQCHNARGPGARLGTWDSRMSSYTGSRSAAWERMWSGFEAVGRWLECIPSKIGARLWGGRDPRGWGVY